MSRILGLSLLFVAWLQPSHFLPWMSWHSEVLAFLALISLALGIRDRHLYVWGPLPWVFLVLSALVTTQTLTGLIDFAGDAWVYLLYFLLGAGALLVGSNTQSETAYGRHRFAGIDLLTGLAVAMLVGAMLSICIALAQALWVWTSVDWVVRLPWIRRPGGNLGQSNQLATLILMALGGLVFLVEEKRISVSFAVAATGFLLLGLALTESRTGGLGFALLCVWYVWGWQKLRFRAAFTPIAFSIAFYLTLLKLWPLLHTWVMQGGWVESTPGSGVDLSPYMRFVVWPQVVAAILMQPWFGWGLGGTSKALNAVQHAYPLSEPYTYAHNIGLDLAVGFGMPLALVCLIGAGWWLWTRLRAVNHLRAWFCIAIIIPFSVHSLLEFPFAYAYLLLPVMLVVGALERLQQRQPQFAIPRAVVLGTGTVAFIVMLQLAWEYVRVEEDFRVARFETLRIGSTDPLHERPHLVLLTQFDALLEVTRLKPTPGMTKDAIDRVRKVALRFPWTATQNRYALALALNGDPAEARRQLQVMRAMHGEKMHQAVIASWTELARSRYPQLNETLNSE